MSSVPYPRLKAPQDDGQVLLWPEAAAVLQATRANHAALGRQDQLRLCGVPLSQLRTWQRRWLGHAAADAPLVATGHQAELYHPGVWVKNIAIDAVARKLDGVAMHFSVDTDSPKHLQLRWPGGGVSISDDPAMRDARWTGRLRCPSAGHVQAMKQQVEVDGAAAGWSYQPVAVAFLERLQALAGQDMDLPSALADAHQRVDRDLGLLHQSVVCSAMWSSSGYLAFTWHLLSRAEEFASAYNRALADYRQRQGIHSQGRPMPDLSIDGDFCEAPFWIDSLADGFRKRAMVVRGPHGWTIRDADDVFELPAPGGDGGGGGGGWASAEALQRWLRQHKLRLSPRALTLTMFLRLCVADQFVHGIGGGLYDQVADQIIQDWFGIQAPAFSVATATMLFPAAVGRQRVCLHCLRQEGRAIREAALGPKRRQWAQRIAELPRRSAQRREQFIDLHRELDRAARQSADLQAWDKRYQEALAQHDVEAAIFDRELPYVIQSRPRLQTMIAQFNSMLR